MLATIAWKSPRVMDGSKAAAILSSMPDDDDLETPKQPGEAEERDAEGGEAETIEDEPMETPFDHPLFLPAVLLGLSLWFFWDGFVVPMEGHLAFNRWGFAVLAVATAWFGYRGFKEMRQARSDDRGRDDQPVG